MKNQNNWITLISVGLLFAGCSDNLDMPDSPQGENRVPITLSASYPSLTRASDNGFEDKDEMGVYVLDYEADAPQDISGTVHADNIKYTFDGSSFTWRGTTDLYWTSATTPADIIAYYPFIHEIGDEKAVSFTIDRRQDLTGDLHSMAGYEASDFLYAKSSNTMPTSSKVDLTFHHIMAGIKVTLAEGSGFDEGEWNSIEKNVFIPNILPTTTVNLANGEVSEATGSPTTVTTYKYQDEWRAVVVPQTVKGGNGVITVMVDGVTYKLTKTSDITYLSGKMHPFTITVDKRGDSGQYEFKLSEGAVTAWLDTPEFRDGFMRQYVTVTVDAPGNLGNCITAAGLNPKELTALKIVGQLNEDDFKYIRENLSILSAVNLKEATIPDNEGRNYLPKDAFREIKTLNYIIFPDNLVRIGDSAFFKASLAGSLILPEGLEVIEGGAFCENGDLIGELSLPSTLKEIGGSAFCYTRLSGNLVLPESLIAIGGGAFGECRFTGNLNLPKNLEYIGEDAFSGSFSGDLVIPQSIKTLGARAFVNCGFSGTLTIPEGLTIIESQVFQNCGFRGELVLPSTLKRIDNNAFANTRFSNIVFPKGLLFLGSEAFANCNRLSGKLEIPENLTAINHGTFSGCTLLSEIVIGDNISKIEGQAFSNCYNLTSIVVNNPEPPLFTSYSSDSHRYNAFDGVPMDNFTLQVPQKSISLYASANGWREFKRIAAYSNFVCRPAKTCALNNAHEESLVINSDGEWEITHCPDWCTISRTSGDGKTPVSLTINELSKGSGNRTDYVEFTLKGTEFTTRCEVSQYDYQYGEDECVTLQSATKGNGIDILFIGDGFDAEAISSGDYLELVNKEMEYFFGVEPYTTYRDYFNVYICFPLSQEAGVNTTYTWRNTRFMTTYATAEKSGNKLVVDDFDGVMDYAVEKSPLTRDRMSQSLVIMALNSDEYGSGTFTSWTGATLSICAPSVNPYPSDTRGVVQHEACGHGFGKLADETVLHNRYVYSYEIEAIENAHKSGWYQNISVNGNIYEVPWSHFIFDPRYSDYVDVFEGGYSVLRGVYRPEINSCMNYGIPYFNAMSRQDIVRRILEYAGEEFTMEKFYATDTNAWGKAETTRGYMPDMSSGVLSSGSHRPITFVKSKKY